MLCIIKNFFIAIALLISFSSSAYAADWVQIYLCDDETVYLDKNTAQTEKIDGVRFYSVWERHKIRSRNRQEELRVDLPSDFPNEEIDSYVTYRDYWEEYGAPKCQFTTTIWYGIGGKKIYEIRAPYGKGYTLTIVPGSLEEEVFSVIKNGFR